MKKFDLNIEEILEDWEIYHGIRELISKIINNNLTLIFFYQNS